MKIALIGDIALFGMNGVADGNTLQRFSKIQKKLKSRLAYGVFLWYNIVKKKVSVLLCLTEASHVKRHHGMD